MRFDRRLGGGTLAAGPTEQVKQPWPAEGGRGDPAAVLRQTCDANSVTSTLTLTPPERSARCWPVARQPAALRLFPWRLFRAHEKFVAQLLFLKKSLRHVHAFLTFGLSAGARWPRKIPSHTTTRRHTVPMMRPCVGSRQAKSL